MILLTYANIQKQSLYKQYANIINELDTILREKLEMSKKMTTQKLFFFQLNYSTFASTSN